VCADIDEQLTTKCSSVLAEIDHSSSGPQAGNPQPAAGPSRVVLYCAVVSRLPAGEIPAEHDIVSWKSILL
jgi:hypothetical protein